MLTVVCRDNDKPSTILYHEDGSLWSEYWYVDDILHRLQGPADILYRCDNTTTRSYYINRIEVDKHPNNNKQLNDSKQIDDNE